MSVPDTEYKVTTKTVLIIEDDPDMNELMSMVMEQSGFVAFSAFDWNEAYKILNERTPDLILLDFMLPDANGSDICRAIAKDGHLSAIPIIMVSTLRDLPTKVSSLLAGAVKFMSKPFSFDELVNAAEQALKKRTDNVSIWEEISNITHKNGGDNGS